MVLKVVALIMIVSMMLGTGLQVDGQHLRETLREYGLLARVFLANFILLPAFAALLIWFFHVDKGVAAGILLMSMAPGASFLANSAGRKAGGSLSLALTVSFLFKAISVITIPITIGVLTLIFASAPMLDVPVAKTLTTLVLLQLLPLILGALIGPRLTTPVAEKAIAVLHYVFLVSVLAMLVIVAPRLVESVAKVSGLGHLAIIAAIGLFGLAIGWFLGGPEREYRRTLSIATLMRNVGLCVSLASEPELANTLALPTVFAYLLVTVVLSLPVRALFAKTKDNLKGG